MASFKNFTSHVVNSKFDDSIIELKHEKKMQVRPIKDTGYAIEIKTNDNIVKLTQRETKALIQYLIEISF
jgi:hypothetical protein